MRITTLSQKKLLTGCIIGLITTLMWLWLPQPAQADTPVYARPGGSDLYCVGIANVDFSPDVAPACAVQSFHRAIALAGPTGTIIIYDAAGPTTILLAEIPSLPPPDEITLAATPITTLTVTKTDSPDPVMIGTPLTYTISVQNIGPAQANPVALNDILPNIDVVTQTKVTASQGICAIFVTPVTQKWSIDCDLQQLNSGATATVTVVVTPTAAGNIRNLVTVDAGAEITGDSAETTTEVQGTTDLSILKTDSPDPVLLGQPLTYTIAVSNTGSVAAASVVITDHLPSTVTFNQASPNCDPPGGGIITCYLTVLNVGQTSIITMNVTPTTVGAITNTAYVSGGGSDPVSGNNVSTATTTVAPAVSLSVTKSDAPDPVAAGNALTYTVVVRNNGPSTATSVTLTDDLPPEVTLNPPALPSQGVCGSSDPLVCNLGALAAGNSATVTVRANVQPATGGVITNTASVTATQAETTTLDNTALATTTVQARPVFTVSKTAQPPSGSTVEPYDTLTYTIVVENLGAVSATNTVITDDLQLTAFDYVTATLSNGGSLAGPDPLLANVGTLPPGQAVTLTVVVNVNPVPAGTVITNSAGVGGDAAQPQISLATTHVVSSGVTPPSFTLAKSAQPPAGSPVSYGDIISYTVVVSNSGGGAFSALITDTIPTSTTYVGGSAALTPVLLGTANFNGAAVIGQIPYFLPNSAVTMTFRVQVATVLTFTISNQASLASSQTALQTSNIVTHPVQALAPTGPITLYLPIILKDYTIKSASMFWDSAEPVRDKVRNADGIAGLIADGAEDGLFKVTINTGSEGPLQVVQVRLESTQGVTWDTVPGNSNPVLGIFDGGTRLNNADGTIDQTVNGVALITLYAADDAGQTRFVPELYTYTVYITFNDGSILSASATIPPDNGGGTPPTPVPPTPTPVPCGPDVLATVPVGNSPRGVAVDASRSNRAYVANFGSSSVSVVQGTAVLSTISGVTSANGIAYDPTNDRIWVTNYSTNQVTPINAGTLAKQTAVTVGSGPWGVVHNTDNNYVYVVNRDGDSVTVINGATGAVVATLSGGNFNDPTHIDVDTDTGKVYVVNHGGGSVTVIEGTSVSKVVSLQDSSQPYGIAVDSSRELVYVTSVDSHRITVLGELAGINDSFLGWAAFHRGFNDPARPVPLREIAINPGIGDSGDGGHLWTSTSTNDGSEQNQALLIGKGWPAYFHIPLARSVGSSPGEGAAVDTVSNRAYITSGSSSGAVTIFQDTATVCLEPFSTGEDGFGFDLHVAK